MKVKGIKNILLLIMTLLSLASCSKVNSYKQLNEISYDSILSQKESNYLVYIMSNTCKVCEDIQDDIFSYATKAKQREDMPSMYYINISNVAKNKDIITDDDSSYEYFVGTSNYTDIKITATPALIIIEEGKVEYFISSKNTQTSKSDIKNYLIELSK